MKRKFCPDCLCDPCICDKPAREKVVRLSPADILHMYWVHTRSRHPDNFLPDEAKIRLADSGRGGWRVEIYTKEDALWQPEKTRKM